MLISVFGHLILSNYIIFLTKIGNIILVLTLHGLILLGTCEICSDFIFIYRYRGLPYNLTAWEIYLKLYLNLDLTNKGTPNWAREFHFNNFFIKTPTLPKVSYRYLWFLQKSIKAEFTQKPLTKQNPPVRNLSFMESTETTWNC